MTVKYLVKAHPTRQDDVIQLFLKTFPDSIKDVSRCQFPIGTLYCYLYVEDYLESAQLIILNHTLKTNLDCELTIYQDIETIPLMNKALADSKVFKDE